MMEVVDAAYLRRITEQPDGFDLLERFVCDLIEKRKTTDRLVAILVRNDGDQAIEIGELQQTSKALLAEIATLRADRDALVEKTRKPKAEKAAPWPWK